MAKKLKRLNDLELFEGDIPKKFEDNIFVRDYLHKSEVQPYLVYTILKEIFGEPKNEDFDEDKTEWQYLLKFEDFYIEIYDWKLSSVSIAIYDLASNKQKSQELAETIDSFLVKLSQSKKSKVKSKIKEAKHKIFENPFMTYYSLAESLLELSNELGAMMVDHYDFPNVSSLYTKKDDIYKSAFLMFLSSFEGFLNILYELYLQPELRSDRLFERISREQIDIKLRLAPVYCSGFKVKTINKEDERFKNYLRLVNLRNDYIHANLIKSLETYLIEEDGKIFWLENEDSSEIPTNINRLNFEHVEFAKKSIDEVIELVFESMETKTRREFERVIFESEIQVESVDDILIPI